MTSGAQLIEAAEGSFEAALAVVSSTLVPARLLLVLQLLQEVKTIGNF